MSEIVSALQDVLADLGDVRTAVIAICTGLLAISGVILLLKALNNK